MTKAKMPPRSQASLLARPTPDPTMQQQEHRDNSPPLDASATDDGLSAAAGAAKKKKKKGKGKRADDDLVNGNLHPQSMSTSPFSATAQAQADLLATASDLYRRIEADPQGIPDDDAYWTSLPSHLRTFIRNALPIGQLPTSAQNDLDDPASRQASTQAMIAVAQQLAQAAHASQRHLQQHPPDGNISFQHKQSGAYPPFPFDPSVFADLALQTEQALPLHPHPNSTPNGVTAGYQYSNHANPPPTQPPGEPLPAPVVLVNEFDDEQGDFDDDYYSDDDMDHHEAATLDSRDGTWSNEMLNGAHPNGLVTKSQSAAAKKKNKKKKKKGGTDAAAATNPAAALQNPSPPASNPPPRMATNNPANFNSNANTPLPPRSAAQHAPPLPSSRAAGKQPMTFSTASGKAPANTRTTANGHTHSHGPMTNAIGKRPASTAASSHGHGSVNGAAGGAQAASRAWSSSSAEERERIKDFWLGLNEKERKGLIKIEKDGVLKKMKEQQKHGCSCAVCGRKRSSIEDELEVLYDAYYDELEQYASHQQKFVESGGQMPPPPGPGPFPGSVALDSQGAVIGGNALTKPATAKRPPHQHTHPPPPRTKTALPPEDDDQYEEDLEDDEYEDDYEYDEEDEEDEELDEPEVKPGHRRRADAGVARPNNKGSSDLFNFGSSLTVKGGILTVADDLLKNDGQKFLEMMEQLAERRAIREEEVQAELDNASEGEDLDDEDVEEEEEEAEEDALTDEQRMEEGRRMFQIFAARMFEQRVLQAYREKVAQERQLQLLRELEEEDMAEKEKEAKKAKENQKKKDKKRQAKQQKEEERLKLEQEKAAEEAAARAKVEKQREAELRKQEELRLRREAEKRQKEEERAKKEEEKRRRQEEERQRELDKERKKREKEDKAKMEKEARERELREAKEAKDLEAKAKEEEERKAREQREKQAKEEQDKDLAREKAEKARKEQQQQRQGSPEILAPISPAAAKSQNQSTPNSPSASLHVGASSPLSRKAESHSDLPPSPAQFRSAAAASAANAAPVNISNAHRGAGPPPRPVMPVQATPSPSTLPAPPQGLPARPNTLSHGPSASLTIPTGSSSLPRPPVQNQNASGTIGSPARQGTPTASGSSAAGKVTSPPPQATSHGLTTAGQSATGMTFTKSSNGNGNAPPSQPAPQATGRYPGMSFGAPGASTPTRSPPRSLPPNAFMAGSNGKGTFDSMLSSPPNVNAATAGVASMNMGVLSGSAAPAPSHMPIGPIGGGLPSSAAAGPVHNRTPSISNAGISDDYARQTIGGGLSRPISRPAPGPIGPIGRRRDPSHDDFAHGNSGTSNLFGSDGNLPERILGSSALGGDDELVEPQPRRTSHNTAPMSNPSSLFGSSTFGVSSPWTSSFAGAGNGPTNAGGSGPGNARTPSTPNPSMLHNALGTGLTSPTGLGGPPTPSGSSTFSSLHHSGAAPGLQGPLSAGADPWARAANGWDRARYAFEQPASQQQQQQPQSAAATYPQQHQPLGGSGLGSFGAQSQHPLRGMFGMPHQTSPHRHTTDRGL